MGIHSIIVKAEWDNDACVWVATSNDIDGLALEASSMELLMEKVPGALCDLLELNGYADYSDFEDIPYHIMAQQIGKIQIPCD